MEEQKIQQQAAARARKQKMLDLEEIRKKNIKKSDIEIEMDAKNKILHLRADQMKLDDHDDVKDMNKMVAYSKCVTIRDKQLIEKQKRIDEEQAEEERLDLMMEIERLKKIQQLEQDEENKVIARKQGAIVIQNQIKERSQLRIISQEQKEKEAQQMVKLMRKLEDDDDKERELKA